MARPSVCIFQESLSKTDRCCTCLDYRQEGHCSWHTVGDQITWFRQCPSDSTNLKMRRTSAAQSRWMYAPRAMQMHGLWTIMYTAPMTSATATLLPPTTALSVVLSERVYTVQRRFEQPVVKPVVQPDVRPTARNVLYIYSIKHDSHRLLSTQPPCCGALMTS